MRRLPERELSVLTARDPQTIFALKRIRVSVTAPATDPLWEGASGRVNRAYGAVDKETRIVPDNSFTYQPQYPDDWLTHPDALRVLDMIGYHSATPRGPMGVYHYRLNGLFFVVTADVARRMLSGEKTENDLLDMLEAAAT